MTFAGPPAALDLQSHDGRVTARVPAGSYAVTVRSKEGSERSEVDHDRDVPRTIVARSTTGDVRVLER